MNSNHDFPPLVLKILFHTHYNFSHPSKNSAKGGINLMVLWVNLDVVDWSSSARKMWKTDAEPNSNDLLQDLHSREKFFRFTRKIFFASLNSTRYMIIKIFYKPFSFRGRLKMQIKNSSIKFSSPLLCANVNFESLNHACRRVPVT